MNIHEHQAEILSEYGAPVSKGLLYFPDQKLKKRFKHFRMADMF